MQVKINDKPNYEKEILFSLTPTEMEKFLDNAASSLSKDMKIKGFREGKMPRSVVEGVLGKERVWREAANEAVEKSYVAAIAEHKLEAVGRPRVEILKLVPGNNFEFKATIPLFPNIELPDYSAIARRLLVEKQEEIKVDDKEIDDSLKWLQKSRIQQSTDSVSSDSHANRDGQTGQNQAKDGSGAPLKELPEINDEFARSLGNFENLETLKKNLREGIKLEKEKKQKDLVRLKIMEEIARKAKVEVSEILIENELDKMQEEFEEQISQMGLSMEKYLEQISQKEANTQTINDLRSGWRRLAREKVTTSLLLRAIADYEHIEPSVEEITNEVDKYLERFGNIKEAKKNPDSRMRNFGVGVDPALLKLYIRDILRNKKVFEFLENCK